MEITTVLALAVLAFASYRVTRFLVIDSLIENVRARFQTFLFNRDGKFKLVWHKLLDLISCTWCTGFWVSLVLYSVYVWTDPTQFSRIDWLSVFAVAGLQGLLHAWEPGE